MMRGPPKKSRRIRMVETALRLAEDDTYGYSQKPPSGRWGPDFDCSSLMYFIANQAGYNVDIGSDNVRFTGTMLKDFEKAGFQILPFANVGISDLKIGDILLNLALHAEVYVGNGETVAANSSEDGGYVGSSGDQTGHEIEKHPVVTFDRGWDYILRPPDDEEDDEVMECDEEGDDDVPMNYAQPQGMNGMWPNTTPNSMYPQNYPQGTMGNRSWGNPQGYPQGNLGQMNGYSQANAGGYPQTGMQGYQHGYQQGYQQNMNPQGYQQNGQQGYSQGYQQNGQQGYSQGYQQGNMMPMGPQGMENDLCFVMGIEGAKNLKGIPNSRKAVFDEDKAIMYIVSFDQQGNVNNLNVYQFEECSEEMPQHLSPLMKNRQMPMVNQNGMMPQGEYITREEFNELKEMLGNAKPAKSSNESNGSRTNQQPNGNRLNARTN